MLCCCYHKRSTGELVDLILAKCKAASNFSFLTRTQLAPATKQAVVDANWGAKHPYSFKRLEEGLDMARITWQEDSVVLSAEDSARLWAYSKYVLECRVMRDSRL